MSRISDAPKLPLELAHYLRRRRGRRAGVYGSGSAEPAGVPPYDSNETRYQSATTIRRDVTKMLPKCYQNVTKCYQIVTKLRH